MVRAHTACRACGAPSLQRYLDLGTQAPANALRRLDWKVEFHAPLTVAWCDVCGLSQLEQIVDPEVLYPQDYPFRAGKSDRWRQHCAQLAGQTTNDFAWDDVAATGERAVNGLWLDIGANDGTMLDIANAHGWQVLGVDPSPTETTGVPILPEFWGAGCVDGILRFHGKPKVITATNVFGHVDDARDFLQAAQRVLHPWGRVVIECPHILPLLESVAFDTIYHEHLSYWSLQPLEVVARQAQLKVVSVQGFPDLHGGTMRYVLMHERAHEKPDSSVTGLRILENGLFLQRLAPYLTFARQTQEQIARFQEAVLGERVAQRVVAGYGANAKAAVRLQAAQLGATDVAFIVDDAKGKQGMLMPGVDIPIRASGLDEADVLILFSWNNAAELEKKARRQGFRGRVLNPVTLRAVA